MQSFIVKIWFFDDTDHGDFLMLKNFIQLLINEKQRSSEMSTDHFLMKLSDCENFGLEQSHQII